MPYIPVTIHWLLSVFGV